MSKREKGGWRMQGIGNSRLVIVSLVLGLFCLFFGSSTVVFAAGVSTVDGFEEIVGWSISATSDYKGRELGNTSFTVSGEEIFSGAASGKLSYWTTKGKVDMTILSATRTIAGKPAKLGLAVFGNESRHRLDIRLRDATGEYFLYTVGDISWKGWKDAEIDLSKPYHFWGGGSDGVKGKFDYPVTAMALIVVSFTWDKGGEYVLYLDDLRVTSYVDMGMGSGPAVSIAPTADKPILDGVIDDKVWKNAALIADLYRNDGKTFAAQKTRGLIAYDDEYLYIGLQVSEPSMETLKARVTQRDGPVWEDDCIEILLKPGATNGAIYHLIINALGAQYDERCISGQWDPTWNGDWQVKTHADSRGWSAEIAVPFSSMDVPSPKEGDTWLLNLCRSRKTADGQENSSWVPTASFLNTEAMGQLRFGDRSLAAEIVSYGELRFGHNHVRLRVTNPSHEAGQIRASVILAPSHGESHENSYDITLSGEETREVAIPYEIKVRGRQRLGLVLRERATDQLLYATYPYDLEIQEIIRLDLDQLYYYQGEAEAIAQVTYEEPSEPGPAVGLETKHLYVKLLVHRRDEERSILTRADSDVDIAESRKLTLKIPIGSLPPQNYTVRAILTDHNGDVLGEGQAYFGIVQRSSNTLPPIEKVEVGRDGEILLNGRPFFPIGLYHVRPDDYPRVRQQGFNYAMGGWTSISEMKWQLDLAQKANLYLDMGLPNPGGQFPGVYGAVSKVESIKGHPALLFYHLGDEPRHDALGDYADAYRAVKKADPLRLQTLTTADHPYLKAGTDEILKGFADATDVISPDIYPVGRFPMTLISDSVSRTRALIRDMSGKSIIFVAQCFSWPAGGYPRFPSPEEMRLMAYLAIMAGAKGIAWYSYREGLEEAFGIGEEAGAKLWSFFKRLNSELAELTPAIVTQDVKGVVATDPANDLIALSAKTSNGKLYVFAVNPTNTEMEVSLRVKGLSDNSKVDVFYEFRSVMSRGDMITDLFGPYAVHIYEIALGDKS